VALEARGLGSVSINPRMTAVRKLAAEAADNELPAPELAAGIARVKGVKSKGVRVGNWLSIQQAQKLLNAPDVSSKKGMRDRAILALLLGCGLRPSEVASLTLKHIYCTAVPGFASRRPIRRRARQNGSGALVCTNGRPGLHESGARRGYVKAKHRRPPSVPSTTALPVDGWSYRGVSWLRWECLAMDA
jgi:hypothetical protein